MTLPVARCLAHRKHLASCTNCVRHLLASQRATTAPAVLRAAA